METSFEIRKGLLGLKTTKGTPIEIVFINETSELR